jgi:hypothetical protein
MMRAAAFTLMLLVAVPAAAQMYKWVDRNGVTHYSDRPAPGAERIEIQPAQTFSAPRPSTPARGARAGADPNQPFRYDNCAISSPANDEVFLNVQRVSASWQFTPALRPGDTVRVVLDGQLVPGLTESAQSVTFDPIVRGTHTLQITALDEEGRTACESSVTFHVRQPSLLQPNRVPPRPQPR